MTGKPAILFDIDGTMLYAKGVGRASFDRAFREAYGVAYPDIKSVSFVGATDIGVIRSMARTCGVENPLAREEHFFFLLAQYLNAAMIQTPPLVFPGVPQLLDALAGRGYALGLVTGNIRTTAWEKVRHSNIDRFFTFGAYGDESPDRAAITRLAQSRVPPGFVPRLLVGDTPLDVAAAHANGLPALTVGTGWVTMEDLHASGSETVLKDFSDTQSSLRAFEALLY